jgi:hypothetical protein
MFSEIPPPHESSSLSQPSNIAVFKEVSSDKQKAEPPHQASSYFLYYSTFVVSKIYYSPNPNDPTFLSAKLPYQRYVPNYHMLHLFCSHGIGTLASLLHPTIVEILSFITTAFALFPFTTCHIPRNHLSFVQALISTQ